MRQLFVGIATAALIAATFGAVPSQAVPAAPRDGDRLDAYTARVAPEQLDLLTQQGLDIVGQARAEDGLEVGLVLTRDQRDRLRDAGVDLELTRVEGGQTVQEFAEAQAVNGYTVWRSYDEAGGIRDQMYDVARDQPRIAKLVRLGTSTQGREILAIKLTRGARGKRDGARPAVLYSSTQHAREWISTEVNRRLMNHYIDGWRAKDKQIRKLLRTTELWFVLVANPDGYQYTFDTERLWRKTLRDNDRDGEISVGDGVDPNRNYPNHWGYDEEGSSSIPSSETYRGPRPASEPETRALKGLLDRIGFVFQVNWHSAGEWLLYGLGWQIATPSPDDPISYALSGNLDNPAIEGYHPGLSSDVLYATNGETNDYAYDRTGALAWTPELSEGCEGCGFVFPDDEDLVQAEFERNLPFADSVARSARTPANPKSVLGIRTKAFYLKSDDPYKEGIPGANFTFKHSFGDRQPVAVLAKRSLGKVKLKYRINGGRTRTGRTHEWRGGERYDPPAVHYRQMRGKVRGTRPGDRVRVWFRAKGKRSDSFTYRVLSDTGNRVLVVAAEDYTGASPAQEPGPHYLDHYLAALAANGIAADVYDVDARGRTAPDHLGVLAHYDAVIWYPGDDVVTRTEGRGPGNADRLAMDEMLEMRAYLNEGGRVLYTGDMAGEQYTGNVGTQLYDPLGTEPCDDTAPEGQDPRRCLALRGSGDGTNDVLQYWFGGYLGVLGDGLDGDGNALDVIGTARPLDGFDWALNGGDSADNQHDTSSFIATSGILPVTDFPLFESWPSSKWDKPGGPFDPHSGSQYVYSKIADVSYKRLSQTIEVPNGGDQTLRFWTSYDTEVDWDFFLVEARTPGQDDWTTLPDLNGHTTTEPGDSCAGGWTELHPQLEHYVTWDGEQTCLPTGTTGEWHAASGSSGGWVEWEVDLSAWAGTSVDVSLSYVNDWAIQNLGVFLDDVTLPDGTSTSFEAGLDGWTISGAPPGSAENSTDWTRSDSSGFPVGASITTPDTILMGYGIEGIRTQAQRNAVIGRAMEHLLD